MSKANSGKLIRFIQIFSARLVLEVFGGARAIWGFSEAVGFRVPSTVWFWRPCALAVGAIFFGRWLSQVQDYILEEKIRFSQEKLRLEKAMRKFRLPHRTNKFIADLVWLTTLELNTHMCSSTERESGWVSPFE